VNIIVDFQIVSFGNVVGMYRVEDIVTAIVQVLLVVKVVVLDIPVLMVVLFGCVGIVVLVGVVFFF